MGFGAAVCRRSTARAPTFRVVTDKAGGTVDRTESFTLAVWATDENGCLLDVNVTATLSLSNADASDALGDSGFALTTVNLVHGIWSTTAAAIYGGTGAESGVTINATASGYTTASSNSFSIASTVATGTALLLHMDGADQSTTFTDSSPFVHTVTAHNDARLVTAYKRFGTAGGAFETSAPDVDGDWLTVPDNSIFDFGNGDFTLECQFYPTETNRMALLAWTGDYRLAVDYHYQGTRNINIWASSNGTSWDMINADPGGNGIGSTSLTLNAWNHVAIVRSGNNWLSFVNGTKDIDITVSGTVKYRNEELNISLWGNAGPASYYYINGYLDEYRIAKGIAKWTSSFTPPTAPYDY